MKRILFLFAIACAALFTTVAYGQEDMDDVSSSWKELSFLVGEENAKFILDLSDAIITGVPVEDYKEIDEEWDTEVKNMTSRFIAAFNGATLKADRPFKIGLNMDSNLEFVLRILEASERGSNVRAQFEIQDKQENLLFSTEVKAERGMWGTRLNLMGDALEAMGEKIAKKICSLELDNKPLKLQLKNTIGNGETIAIRLNVSSRFSRELRDELKIRKVTEAIFEQMVDSFESGFIEAYGKKHQIEASQLIRYTDGYEGNVLNLYLLSIKDDLKEMKMSTIRVEYKLITDNGDVFVGMGKKGSKVSKKDAHLKHMKSLGSELGNIK